MHIFWEVISFFHWNVFLLRMSVCFFITSSHLYHFCNFCCSIHKSKIWCARFSTHCSLCDFVFSPLTRPHLSVSRVQQKSYAFTMLWLREQQWCTGVKCSCNFRALIEKFPVRFFFNSHVQHPCKGFNNAEQLSLNIYFSTLLRLWMEDEQWRETCVRISKSLPSDLCVHCWSKWSNRSSE